jgi:thymidylate synthase (FAD)
MLSIDRFVTKPTVTIAARTVMMFDDLVDSVEAIGAMDAMEIDGTPLNALSGRVGGTNQGIYNHAGSAHGNADDIAEYAGRQCYSSWKKGRGQADYIGNILRDQHGSVMEHANLVFQVVGVSRALTHELIRHRVGTAYSQQSQRYVDARDIRFVVPPLVLAKFDGEPTEEQLLGDPEFQHFWQSCQRALDEYRQAQMMYRERMEKDLEEAEREANGAEDLVKRKTAIRKRANEAARAYLPNGAETMLVFTTNIRALRHIVQLRGSVHADLEIRRFSSALLNAARPHAPEQLRDLIESDIGSDEYFRNIISELDQAA